MRRWKEKEPLGAFVMRVPVAATFPPERSVTSQRTPLRFWSTSNSVSRRPLSGLTLSFHVLPSEHEPERTTRLSLPPRATAGAAGGGGGGAGAAGVGVGGGLFFGTGGPGGPPPPANPLLKPWENPA